MSKPLSKLPKCPVCGKQTHQEHKPFCSARCKNVDLGKWLNETYTIPVDEYSDENYQE